MNRPMRWALNVVYLCLLLVCAPIIVWAMLTKGKYREGFAPKLLGYTPRRMGDAPCIWLHAVSVGEVNLLESTLAELAARQPAIELVVSTTTKTGFDLAQRKYGDTYKVFYCPLDFSWAVQWAIRRVRPTLLVLAELEFWPNLISAAKQHGAGVAIINGRLSENSFRGYQRVNWLVRRVLQHIDLIAAQDETTAKRFRSLLSEASDSKRPTPAVVVSGSLKYDGAETNRANARTESLRLLAGFSAGSTIWLTGSTQAPEEEMAIRIFGKLVDQHSNLRLVIVPRHPERFDDVARQLDSSGLSWRRRSELTEPVQPQPPTSSHQSSILLVDTIGELGAWWGMAEIGFVGGSFGDRGGQNMIEPAAYGVATCFGPNTWNFRDIVASLLGAGGAEIVEDEAALEAFVARCLAEPKYARSLGERGRQFVASHLGATTRTVDLLEQLLPTKSDDQQAAA